MSLSDILVSDLVLCILNCIFHHRNDRMWFMVYIPVFKYDDNSMNTSNWPCVGTLGGLSVGLNVVLVNTEHSQMCFCSPVGLCETI